MINTALALKAGFASYGINESKVIYALSENGKPFTKNFTALHFSISHTEDFSIVAFYNKEIGIDCEKYSRNIPKEILNRYFSQEEARAFSSDPLRLWTAKEAFVKHTGKGFAMGRNGIEIPYFDDEMAVNGVWFKRFVIDGHECTLCTEKPDEIEIHQVF